MKMECSNNNCEENCIYQMVGNIKAIDNDKYSTMYEEQYEGTCSYCNTFQEITKEYWENNETGDIYGVEYR